MPEDPTVIKAIQLEMEADRLREAKTNLEALMGLATEVPILEPYVDKFSEAVSALQDRLREIGADEPELHKYLFTE